MCLPTTRSGACSSKRCRVAQDSLCGDRDGFSKGGAWPGFGAVHLLRTVRLMIDPNDIYATLVKPALPLFLLVAGIYLARFVYRRFKSYGPGLGFRFGPTRGLLPLICRCFRQRAERVSAAMAWMLAASGSNERSAATGCDPINASTFQRHRRWLGQLSLRHR